MEKEQVKIELIVIGGSSGSLDVLLTIFALLNRSFTIPIIIVLHRNKNADTNLIKVLSTKINLKVKEADEKEPIRPGNIYLAPPDYHLLIEKDRTLSLDISEKVQYSRPSIDVTFQSAADVYKSKLLGIILSGANSDGAAGLASIKKNGGSVIVQDPATAQIPYMPQQAIVQTKVDEILSTNEIAQYINSLLK